MNAPAHIYLSFDAADAQTAADFKRQLSLALQPRALVFWEAAAVPVEAFRAEAAAFLERTNLFVAILSPNYEDHPDVRWEAAQAVQVQAEHARLQILTLQARSAAVPRLLQPYVTALPPGETVENERIPRDRQLYRAAITAANVLDAAPATREIGIGRLELPLGIEDLRARLLAQTDRINHAPLLALLKRLIHDVGVKRGVLDVQEKFKQLREKTRLSQISIAELEQQAAPIQEDLYHLLLRLEEVDLHPEWQQIFIRDYYRFVADSRDDSTVPPFFIPVDEIIIPETLNLPVGPSEQDQLEQIGLLSFEQKNEFRRSLLLAKDALAVKNPAAAYAYCDHVRQHIDPQSAQLYEYLLITYVQQETALRAMELAVAGNDRVLQYILLFASRLRDYQSGQKCVSSTANHNLAIASEAVSDAALRLYHRFPNDPLRHTGKHAEAVPDNRRALRVVLGNTLKVCRLVYPSEELLEAAVIECCGGGKCHWIEKVEVVNERFQFVPNGHFDLLGEIHELQDMLRDMEAADPNKIVKGSGLLREDLYFSLLAKRQALAHQVAEDKKRRRPFTDTRESVIRFTYACLLGVEIFGENETRSFYRLALEYLLPGLLTSATPTGLEELSWFTLDAGGEVTAHPECAKYGFDVMGIVEKIVRDMAGQAGWLKVHPNIKQAVYLKFTADTEAEWEAIRRGRSFSDFRRMDSLDARRRLIVCLHHWQIAFRAYPEADGQAFLDRIIRELTGEDLLDWLHFDTQGQLATLPESEALGFDALSALRDTLKDSTRYTEEDLRRSIAQHIFHKQILPQYQSIKAGDESRRGAASRLILAALCAYKLHPDPAFTDFVWQELTEEVKFRWLDVTNEGQAVAIQPASGFDPLAVLKQLFETQPGRYRLFEMRERVATRRFRDTEARYFHEISEYRHENRLPERQVAVEILRKMKALYLFFPQAEFLKLPLDELHGRGRIRWHEKFLGVLPTTSNHYENSYFNFEYKYERYELKRLLDNQFGEMQRVLRETGELD
jgi:hypothetical protein